MKIFKQTLGYIIVFFVLFWICCVAKCEYLTKKYEAQFQIPNEIQNMIDGKKTKKILSYSNSHAQVYFVSSGNSSGDIVNFIKVNGEWKFKNWKTVWSKTGSAEDFIWPYLR
ncbi:hypothetical protein [Flavobacterium sp. HTF]|uniref:hypothetical protein n=1 Tax=Flavobacterium sp. HTF TaxID=2170732 RepID=UPI000D5DD2AD|nr:hypothetical protein [Flavobacterium sp. HTF]PWB20663.1 hypothetical protein DCO46_20440 [Flavobacterium sp. HTF]